jgi:hypothetical protein
LVGPLGEMLLAQQYPLLYYNILQHKCVLIADVLSQRPLNIGFRRGLTDNKWTRLTLRVVHLTDEPDSFAWKLTTIRQFIGKSMYVDMMNGHSIF